MIRFVKKRAKGQAYKGKVYPKPLKRLRKEIDKASKWTTRWDGLYKFEV